MNYYTLMHVGTETGISRNEIFQLAAVGRIKITYFNLLPRLSSAEYKKLILMFNKWDKKTDASYNDKFKTERR